MASNDDAHCSILESTTQQIGLLFAAKDSRVTRFEAVRFGKWLRHIFRSAVVPVSGDFATANGFSIPYRSERYAPLMLTQLLDNWVPMAYNYNEVGENGQQNGKHDF